jgi:uncharacterized iron-regulated membrane protein
MVFAIVGALAILVLIGSATMIWGTRRFHVSTKVLAVAFALTAVSWIALLITTIGLTLMALLLPRASS